MASLKKQRDQQLALTLASGKTIADAGAEVGYSERTVYRRLEDSEFRETVSRLRAEFVKRATAKLSAAATKAVESLEKLLDSPHDPTRLGAARSIIELGTKLRESVELEERIRDLEQTASAKPQQTT